MRIGGGCHCGAIRFAVKADPPVTVLKCNCSICSITGFRHLIVGKDQFELLQGQDKLITYRFGTGQAEHLFCRICGVKSFYRPRSYPDGWSVNFACLDTGHELEPDIRFFDGRNWETACQKLGK